MPRELTVTIKYGKGYDESWAVFKGVPEEVKADLVDYFGLDSASVAGLTLNQLVQNVTQIAHSGATAGAQLGAVALPSKPAAPEKHGEVTPEKKAVTAQVFGQSASTASTNPWDAIEGSQPAAPAATPPAAPAEPERSPVLDLMAATKTVKELQEVWAKNQAAFSDPAVMDVYKARGRELMQQAAA